MTKVTIISGFLGAGKTTFIKKLLEEVYPGENKVLIENEYGEIGIDGGFLKDSGVQITEMNSGCICCTLVGDFTEALKNVIAEYHPDRIIIEPSGVGKLSDIAKAVEAVEETADIKITDEITVVDGKKTKVYMKNFGEFYKDQVQNASVIVMSRTQMMKEDKIQEATALLRAENASAPIITTPWESLSAEAILHALENSEVETLLHAHHDEEEHEHHHHDEECCCHDHEHHHHHDEEGEEHEHEHHHHHDEECEGHEHEHHHHHHDEDCGCHDHEHHHEHDENCTCGCHDHHHHHHADEVFTSWGKETIHKYTEEELEHILKVLSETEEYGIILRAKGIIAMADGSWKQFDMVPEEHEVRQGQPDYTGRICVIGTNLKEDLLKDLFRI